MTYMRAKDRPWLVRRIQLCMLQRRLDDFRVQVSLKKMARQVFVK